MILRTAARFAQGRARRLVKLQNMRYCGCVAGLRFLVSPDAARRLRAAADFVSACGAGTEVLILGATREAADDFVREVLEAKATFGLHRRTLTQLAAELAAARLAAAGLAPAGGLATTAIAARAVFETRAAGQLRYFSPVAHSPGFARAVAATVGELRAAGVAAAALEALGPAGRDLQRLLELCTRGFEAARSSDRTLLLHTAAEVLRERRRAWAGRPVLLLDVALRTPVEAALVEALAGCGGELFATVPAGDERTLALLGRLGASAADATSAGAGGGAPPRINLERVREMLFSTEPLAAESPADDSVVFFSAPGEARECVEIARRILDEARGGVRFDRIAVVLRAPEAYSSHVADAFRRARIPAYFARGTRRPDPAGRAFLCFLDFVAEGFAARRLCEYLAFGRLPQAIRPVWAAPADEALPVRGAAESSGPGEPSNERAQPWRWEQLITDAAVFGGAERWRRRLDALAEEIRMRLERLRAADPESPRLAALEADRASLTSLCGFVLPLIDACAKWGERAAWGEWIARLEALAARVLAHPQRVVSALAELRALAAVAGVSLAEVREVLAERLAELQEDPPAHRFGRVFVGTPEQLRGRSFAMVFVPGLAERIFPQKPREDPLLLDAARRGLDAGLETQADRGHHERLLLRLAVGAAARRLVLSYPRVDVGEARPRVPSFYALEVVRASEGRLPDVDSLERGAAAAGDARMAWPAPRQRARAIDESEYDLAALEPLLRGPGAAAVAGRARFLIELNPHLGRSLRGRWSRWESRQWRVADGLCESDERTRAALQAHRLAQRPYSVSALQQYAACPYRFFLSGIAQLRPRAAAAPIERLDPLSRGSLFHRVQAATLRALRSRGLLPLGVGRSGEALAVLEEVTRREEEVWRERLAPAIERIWEDEMAALRADLRGWLQRAVQTAENWEPLHFELAFGLARDEAQDADSSSEPARLPNGALLRGAVDLVERRRNGGGYRVTDHKTGANRARAGAVVGAGEMLQPALYSLAFEALRQAAAAGEGATAEPARVVEARLWFCTAAGGFAEHVVPIDERTRRRAFEVLEIVDRAVEQGFFPPAPREEACKGCDYREVCGPYEELRWKRKDSRPLEDLRALRSFG